MGMSGHWRVDGVVAYETKTYAYGTKKNAFTLCFRNKLYKNHDDCAFLVEFPLVLLS